MHQSLLVKLLIFVAVVSPLVFTALVFTGGDSWLRKAYTMKGLILAQNERWRRGLGMQVEREPARGTAANGVVRRR